jgi:hypothetical protein
MIANQLEPWNSLDLQAALRRWYQSKTLQLLDIPANDATMSELLREWPTLYPPWTKQLSDYNSHRFGPLLAISDEGSAAPVIAKAAYRSAKAQALPRCDVMNLGIIIDGERMTSAGEAPIGPDEYEVLLSSAFGRTLCSTNVAVRVNTRLYRLFPEFVLPEAGIDSVWIDKVLAAFRPFIDTPDHRPRPLTVRIQIRPQTTPEALNDLFRQLEAARTRFGLAAASVHRFALLLNFEREIQSDADIAEISRLIALAPVAGFSEVVIDAEPRLAARQRLMLPSLLNILEPAVLQKLFDASRPHRLQLTYRYQTDADSAARTIWTGLHTARSYGFTAGKYGLLPLTLEEQRHVVELISGWTKGWTAIPAFYVDTPLVTDEDLYSEARCVEAASVWMRAVAAAGAKIVLIDSPDRISPRRLVRERQVCDDKGVVTLDQIIEIDRAAADVGLKALWSGGITARQAFSLAARQVFGIFSTSATAKHIAVPPGFAQDPQLAFEGEPTEDGVHRVHACVQCGFLSTALARAERGLADEVKRCGLNLLDAIETGGNVDEALTAADQVLVRAWEAHWRACTASRAYNTVAVPANAVRVWRGRRKNGLDQPAFFRKLGSIFMPITVVMQRILGLTAYLPAVLPTSKPELLPDEVALVFYRSQQAYIDSKKYPGGRAYGDLHDVVFDLESSGSGFPNLLNANFELNQPWHLFSNSVDWQKGTAELLAAVRKQGISPEAWETGLATTAASVQSAGGSVDGAIVFATKDWVLFWQHCPVGTAPMPCFVSIADTVYNRVARPSDVEPELAIPCEGFTIVGGEFFNMQFPVL